MPNRDPTIDFDDLPPMQAEKRVDIDATQEALVYAADKKQEAMPAVHHHSHSAMGVAVLALILAGVALAFAGVQLGRQAEKLENARLRVVDLENRLLTTDASVSQSGVALQIMIKDIKTQQDELWTQMDKLWASAWRRNQTDITDHGKKIEVMELAQEKNNGQLTRLDKEFSKINEMNINLKTDIAVLQTEIKNISKIDKNVTQQIKLVAELQAKMVTLEKANAELKKLSEDNAGWVASNNEFRLQTNKTLSHLEQQIKMLQPISK